MPKLSRVTPATLDVLEVLVSATDDLHGFGLAKAAHRPTGSVYLILSRLEDTGWVDSYWEQVNTENEGRPRRRFYRLTPDGLVSAREILAEKRKKPISERRLLPGLRVQLLGRAQ